MTDQTTRVRRWRRGLVATALTSSLGVAALIGIQAEHASDGTSIMTTSTTTSSDSGSTGSGSTSSSSTSSGSTSSSSTDESSGGVSSGSSGSDTHASTGGS